MTKDRHSEILGGLVLVCAITFFGGLAWALAVTVDWRVIAALPGWFLTMMGAVISFLIVITIGKWTQPVR